MEKKEFISRLFSRKIKTEDHDYWQMLSAEILFRIKALDDLNCSCSMCLHDRIYLKNTLAKIIRDKHMPQNPGPKNFTGKGDCGRSSKQLVS